MYFSVYIYKTLLYKHMHIYGNIRHTSVMLDL